MLRPLVVMLAAANIGFWAWSQGWLDGVTGLPRDGDREPQRLAAQIEPGHLQVVLPPSAAGAASAAAPAAEAASAAASGPAPTAALPDDAAGTSSAPLPPEAASAPLPAPAPGPALAAAPAASVAAAPPAEPPPVCLEAGPFNPVEWRSAQTALRRVLDDNRWTLTSREKPGSWIVYIGPYKNRDLMERRADQLRQMQVAFEEARNLPDEYLPGLLFGRHGSESDAREQQARLTAQKIRYVRVVPLVRPTVTHTVRIPKADADMRRQLAALKPRLSGHAFEPCGR